MQTLADEFALTLLMSGWEPAYMRFLKHVRLVGDNDLGQMVFIFDDGSEGRFDKDGHRIVDWTNGQ